MPDSEDEAKGSLEAIRALVEANELSLQRLEDDVLTLDDIVWRSPSKLLVDPTEIITQLAFEADRVASGKARTPPPAALHPVTPEPDPARTSLGQDDIQNAEEAIQARILESLAARGLIDEKGRPLVDEEDLRVVVRAQIEAWLARQSAPDADDPLQDQDRISKTTPHSGKNDS